MLAQERQRAMALVAIKPNQAICCLLGLALYLISSHSNILNTITKLHNIVTIVPLDMSEECCSSGA